MDSVSRWTKNEGPGTDDGPRTDQEPRTRDQGLASTAEQKGAASFPVPSCTSGRFLVPSGGMKTISNDMRAALSDLATLAVVIVFVWLMAF
jgi:hypothetical protein